MKKIMLFGIAIAIVISISGCSDSDKLKAENESLSAQVESLSSELEKVKSEKDKNDKELTSIKESLEAAKKEAELQSEEVVVKVTNTEQIPKDIYNGRYYDYYGFTFEITNNTDKDIQGIEGTLYIRDLFGKDISNFGCDFTGKTIAAGQTITDDTMAMKINEFIDTDMKVYNAAYADLQFEYKISQIVFTDGTVKK